MKLNSFIGSSFLALAGSKVVLAAPSPVQELDTQALNVLVFIPAGKLAEFTEGANSIKAQVKTVGQKQLLYTFQAEKCHSGIVFVCSPVSTLEVNGIWQNRGELSNYSYVAGEVKHSGNR